MRCPKCNAEIPDQAKFCPKCGAAVAAPSAGPKLESGADSHNDSARSKLMARKRGLIIGIVAAVVVIIVAVIIMLVVKVKEGAGNSTPESIEESISGEEAVGSNKYSSEKDVDGSEKSDADASAAQQDTNPTKDIEYEYKSILVKSVGYRDGAESSIYTAELDELGRITCGTNQYLQSEYGTHDIKMYIYDSTGREFYSYRESDGPGGYAISYEHEFDNDGKVICTDIYDEALDHELSSWVEYTYGDDGSLLSEMEYDSDGHEKEYTTYDHDGNKMPQYSYDKVGDRRRYEEWNYDENENCLLYTVYYVDEANNYEIVTQRECTYDSNGNMLTEYYVSEESYISEESEWKRTYSYDLQGNLVLTSYFDADGELCRTDETSYDAEGNVLSETTTNYDSETPEINTNIHERDPNGNLLRVIRYDNDEKIQELTEYTYDSNGNRTSATQYDDDGNIQELTKYTYDSNGNRLQVDTYEDGELTSQKFYKVFYVPIDDE